MLTRDESERAERSWYRPRRLTRDSALSMLRTERVGARSAAEGMRCKEDQTVCSSNKKGRRTRQNSGGLQRRRELYLVTHQRSVSSTPKQSQNWGFSCEYNIFSYLRRVGRRQSKCFTSQRIYRRFLLNDGASEHSQMSYRAAPTVFRPRTKAKTLRR